MPQKRAKAGPSPFDPKARDIPATPAIYLVFDAEGHLIYVGKAKNLRRRLSQYQNAKRLRRHRKMLKIKKEAARLDWILCETEREALALELKHIQEKRPKFNVEGAFFFLYPFVGVAWHDNRITLVSTRDREAYTSSALALKNPQPIQWYGCFRSRHFTGEAFWALAELLSYLGHRESPRRRAQIPKGVRFVQVRGISQKWLPLLDRYFRGDSLQVLEELVLELVDRSSARANGSEIEKLLKTLKHFFRFETRLLKQVVDFQTGREGDAKHLVPQLERDRLFIDYRYRAETV